MATDYQCVLAPDGTTWHLTQEQASPPLILRGGAYTACALWCEFRRGYERRRPTCPVCLRACERDEAKRAKPRALVVPVLTAFTRTPRRM